MTRNPHDPNPLHETNDMDDDADPSRDVSDPYLWDRSGEPDRDVVALESELARARWSGRMPAGPLPAHARPAAARRVPWLIAAGVCAAALAGGAWWWAGRAHGPSAPARDLAPLSPSATPVAAGPVYRAEALSGSLAREELRLGDRLVTDAATRARLEVGDIGSLVVEPGSSVRVEQPGPALAADAEHLLWLERGSITASIFAAPRLFQLGTPSGLAVDLGCVYTATVQDDGTTLLSVRTGQVSFEAEQRRVVVPRGASTRARPGAGPGTPVWDAAPPEFAEAVERLDELLLPAAGGGSGTDAKEAEEKVSAAVDAVLAGESLRANDSLAQDGTLTLWHLLAWSHVPESQRARFAERLAALAPPPQGVSQQACIALDADALGKWRHSLGWSW